MLRTAPQPAHDGAATGPYQAKPTIVLERSPVCCDITDGGACLATMFSRRLLIWVREARCVDENIRCAAVDCRLSSIGDPGVAAGFSEPTDQDHPADRGGRAERRPDPHGGRRLVA